MINKVVILILFVSFLFNCANKESDGIELILLNKRLESKCVHNNCVDFNQFPMMLDVDTTSVNNIVEFKIKNASRNTYVFIPACYDIKKGCMTYNTFPKKHTGISMNNLIFKNDKGEIIKRGTRNSHFDDLNRILEKDILSYNKKMGYADDLSILDALIEKNIILLPAGETVYFESFVSLPVTKPSYFSFDEYIQLNRNEKYNVSLFFKSDSTFVKSKLKKSLLKTMKENNYKLYHGELVSNSIPLVFR